MRSFQFSGATQLHGQPSDAIYDEEDDLGMHMGNEQALDELQIGHSALCPFISP
jgi:hypothetical protein